MKTIDVEVIQDIINNNESKQYHTIVNKIQKAITPEPEFLKGENVEFCNIGNKWLPGLYRDHSGSTSFGYISQEGSSYKQCRKVEKVNLNMKKWEGGECPCNKNDLAIMIFKSGDVGCGLASKYYWYHTNTSTDIMEYHVINLLGDSDE